jgi:hypothetical protein
MSDELKEGDEGYVVPKKVDMEALKSMDSEDESLARYKAQLLGNALSGKQGNK